MNVIILPSARDRDAEANLAAFVAKGRASSAFGLVDFDAPVWRDISLAKLKRVTSNGNDKKNLHFLVGGGGRGAKDLGPLRSPFADFIKALVRLREDARPQFIDNHRLVLTAARHLHAVLESSGYDPCRLLSRHFDEAAQLAASSGTQGSAYAVGKRLYEIARWADEHGIARARIVWSNPIKQPQSDSRVDEAAAQRRQTKMPSEAALQALPLIAAQMDERTGISDLIRMRTVELLVCGGWRINELLTIPADCEVSEGGPDTPGYRYGIRYFAEKNFGATIKWIPTPMISVAKRAIADIRRLTEPVRKDAAYMFNNAGRHPIASLQGDQSDVVMSRDLETMLNLGWGCGPGFLRTRGFPIGDRKGATKAEIVEALRKYMPSVPATFPIRLHQFMFLVRENAINMQKAPIEGTVAVLTRSQVCGFIAGEASYRTVFERFGFTEPDGSPIRVNSHAFRHWLNTLAQEGGMSQELIARWSGRKDIKQNASYDHVSGASLAKKVRDMVESGGLTGQIARVREALPPVDRDTFLATQLATGHVTDIGICIHDWQLAPCPVHGDCANCGEHIVEKGNAQQKSEAERKLGEVRALLAIAETESADGTLGAPRWVEAHKRIRDGLIEVMAVHDDPAVADGNFVHLGDRIDR